MANVLRVTVFVLLVVQMVTMATIVRGSAVQTVITVGAINRMKGA